MFHPLVSRRALCVLALGAAACGTLATAPDAIDKTTKCKGGQLLVKIGKTRVCKRTATLFPNPTAVDARVAFIKQALAPREVRRHGKRFRSIASFGSASKKARAQILRLLPKVLKQVDAAQAARVARAAPRDAGCAAPEDSTYTSKDGNSTMTATMGADGFTLGFDGTTSAGIQFHFRYVTNEGCNALKVPPCPQASGQVDASNTKSDDVIVEATQGGKVLTYTRIKGKRTTNAHGARTPPTRSSTSSRSTTSCPRRSPSRARAFPGRRSAAPSAAPPIGICAPTAGTRASSRSRSPAISGSTRTSRRSAPGPRARDPDRVPQRAGRVGHQHGLEQAH